MSIIPYRRNNASNVAAMLSYLGNNPGLRNQIVAAGRAVGNQLGFPSTQMSKQGPVWSGQQNQSSRQRGKRSQKKKTRTMSVSRGVRSAIPKTVQTYTFIVPLTTATTTGVVNANFWPGYANSNAALGSFGSISTPYFGQATIYQWQRIKRMKVCYRPATAYTTTGLIGVCFTTDPTSPGTGLGSLQAARQKFASFSTDVKEDGCFIWVPINEQDREAKELNSATSSSGAPLRNFSNGVIGVYCSTNLTAGATVVGYLDIEATIELSGFE